MADLTEGQQPSSPAEKDKVPARPTLSEGEMANLTAAEWISRWKQQDSYTLALERRASSQEGELSELRQSSEKLKQQLLDSQQREKFLVRRIAVKEQESHDLVLQLNELKSNQVPTASNLRNMLLDPAINCMIQQFRKEIQNLRSKLEDTQNELAAWKFTPDSNTGKRLMAKCRLLYQENEELGKITSSGRIAKLESDLALQKSFSEEVRQSQNDLDSFLADLDEDVEGMQSTVLFLQQELRKSKETVLLLQKENGTLKMANCRANGDSVINCEQERTTDSESEGERTRAKRIRRSSVLSINYNEDDTLVINSNGDVAMTSDPE
ncbi:hypothetical protein WA026_023749 [Henosepilachna vigintioctopunctata]|uniref:Pre-mRNA-splicing regulator female-lethal(2)D n=1 Tax=Henosepilachna vigintioctopunctata TaxID=420089 RepID=A0AAW1UDR3_9CUCU